MRNDGDFIPNEEKPPAENDKIKADAAFRLKLQKQLQETQGKLELFQAGMAFVQAQLGYPNLPPDNLNILKDNEDFAAIVESMIETEKDRKVIASYQGDTKKLTKDLQELLDIFSNISKLTAHSENTTPEKQASAVENPKVKGYLDKLLKERTHNTETPSILEKLYCFFKKLPPSYSNKGVRGNAKAVYECFAVTYRNYLAYLERENGNRYCELLSYIKKTWVDIYGNKGNYGYINSRKNQQKYRTRAKAMESGSITEIPGSLAIPTFKGYQYGISFYPDGKAYLQNLKSTDNLHFENGKMYFEGELRALSQIELQNMRTKEGIQNIDLSTLHFFIV